MLALDKSLHCIEADEADVQDLFQSESPVTLNLEDQPPQPFDACICGTRREGRIEIYGALLSLRRKTYIFRLEQTPSSEAEYQKALTAALHFMTEMGFSLQSVNLNYSPALRTVIIRNTRVIRPHGSSQAPAAATPTTISPEEPATPAQETTSNAAGVTTPSPAEPPAPPAAHTASFDDETKNILSELQAEIRHLREERDATKRAAVGAMALLKGKLTELTKEKSELENSSMTEIAGLKAEMERLIKDKQDGERESAEKLAALNSSVSDHLAARDQSDRRFRSLLALHQGALQELQEVRRRLELMEAGRERVEMDMAAQTDRMRAAATDLASFKAVTSKMAADLRETEAARDSLELERNDMRLELAAAIAARNELQIKLRQAEARIAEAETRPDTPAVTILQPEGTAMKNSAEPAEEVATEPAPVMAKEDSDRDYDNRATPAEPDKPEAEITDFSVYCEEEPPPLFIPPVQSEHPSIFDDSSSDFFSYARSQEAATPTTFLLDRERAEIEFADPKELTELHHSFNIARISPEGGKPQNCSAHVCALRRNDRHEIYVAISLLESCQTLVYQPERQPDDADEQTRILGEALGFTETVGFMMGEVQLDGGKQTRHEIIEQAQPLRIRERLVVSEGWRVPPCQINLDNHPTTN